MSENKDSYQKTIYLYEDVGDHIGRVEYIDHMGTDAKVVAAARVSYNKDAKKPLDEKDIKLIRHLITNRHTSTLEHNLLTCKLTVPMPVRNQHQKHRTWKYVSVNEVSRRYTNENIEFYAPFYFRTQHAQNKQASNEQAKINPIIEPYDSTASVLLQSHYRNSLELYNKLIAAGICREQARFALPVGMYTSYYFTCDLSNLFHFMDLRLDKHAQLEIRRVAEAILEIAADLWPETIKIYRELRENA